MEISGKIVQKLPLVSGQGKNGEWRKQEYILMTNAQYPKKICFSVWTEKIDQFNIQENEEYKVSIDIESREYNGRWYTDVRAWKVESNQNTSDSNAPSMEQTYDNPFSADVSSNMEDDLPF